MDGRTEDDGGQIEQQGIPSETVPEEIIVEEGTQDNEPQTDPEDEEKSEDELLKDEDAFQTAARVLAKHEKKEKEASEPKVEEAAQAPERIVPDEIEPPARLSAEEKQEFKRLPKSAKETVRRTIQNLEGRFTQAQQQSSEAFNESRHILEAVRPYYTSKPELAARGITESQVVSGLIGNHQILTGEDYAARYNKWIEIGQSIGVADESGKPKGLIPETPDGFLHPTAIQSAVEKALQTRLEPIESFVGSQKQLVEDQQATAAAQEIYEVIETKDAVGNYVYPELQDENYHIQQVKPLVVALVRSIPNLQYGEAYKMAVASLRTKNGKSGQLNPTGLPSNNNSHKRRAAQAGVSARGKTSVAVRPDDIPPEAISGDAMETAAWYIKNRGKL
jgi:hypothetical protein